MSNAKGNAFMAITLTPELEVVGITPNSTPQSLSETMFASSIGISEDGTIWALSLTPDPDGGGSKIYWSNGDGTWNEINTPDPGAVRLSGASGDSCFFVTSHNRIWNMNTQGQGQQVYDGQDVYEMNAGGGYIWATMLEDETSAFPSFYFSPWTTPFNWQKFSFERPDQVPSSLSVNFQGICYGILYGSPMYFSTDGKTSGNVGSMPDGTSLDISFKYNCFLLTSDVNQNGNQVMQWSEEGHFEDAGFRASKILSTFNQQ